MNVVKNLAEHTLAGFEAFESRVVNLEKRAVALLKSSEDRIKALEEKIEALSDKETSDAVDAVGNKVVGLAEPSPVPDVPASTEVSETPFTPPAPEIAKPSESADASLNTSVSSPNLMTAPVTDNGITTAVTSDGVTATLDHASGIVTGTAPDGSSVEPHPNVVAVLKTAAGQ